MTVSHIPIVTVTYNSVELITELLSSLRKHYANTVYVIDGSSAEYASDIGAAVAEFPHTHFHHFDFICSWGCNFYN